MLACELSTTSAVDHHYARLVRNDVPFLGEPKAYPWNVYAAYFKDPDGYLWEISPGAKVGLPPEAMTNFCRMIDESERAAGTVGRYIPSEVGEHRQKSSAVDMPPSNFPRMRVRRC